MRWINLMVFVVALCFCSSGSSTQPPPANKKVIVTRFISPLKDTQWKVNSYKFGEVCEYETEDGKKKNWGRHLGEDVNVKVGTKVYAIAPGKVAYASIHPGKSKDARNWGGVVILGHWISEKEALYSLYGHLTLKEGLERGQYVKEGDELGTVAAALTADNGWWEDAHVHVQICLDHKDVYRGGILSGYAKDAAPNRLEDHMAPSIFFQRFKAGMTIAELVK